MAPVAPTPAPTPAPKPSPSATVIKPTPAPKPSPSTPSAKPTPAPTSATPKPVASKKPVDIAPKPSGPSTKVGIQNLLPGQKIKVTIVDKATLPTAKPSSPAAANSKKKVSIAPKPSGKGAKVGIKNLKPGQKVKVTIKPGGSK